MGWGVQAHLHHDRWAQMEYIPFSSGGIMRVGDLVKIKCFKDTVIGIIISADEKNPFGDILYRCVVPPNPNPWATSGHYHGRHLEVICE